MENNEPWKHEFHEWYIGKKHFSQWSIELIEAYQNKLFSLNDVIEFSSDADSVIIDEINSKLKTKYSPFILVKDRTLLNEVEQKYYQQLTDNLIK